MGPSVSIDTVVLHGPALSMLAHRTFTSTNDFDAILLGFVREIQEDTKDDHAESNTRTVVEACVTNILTFPSTGCWNDHTGAVNIEQLRSRLQHAPAQCVTGQHFLGFAAVRHGVGAGTLGLRDTCLCESLQGNRAVLHRRLAAESPLCSPPRPERFPVLCLQPAFEARADSVVTLDAVVSQVTTAAGGGPGLARLPIRIQNMSAVGGTHLYKAFRPCTGPGMGFAPPELLHGLMHTVNVQAEGMSQAYECGLHAVAVLANDLVREGEELRWLEGEYQEVRQALSGAADGGAASC